MVAVARRYRLELVTAIAVIAAGMADAWTTHAGLERGATEANPVGARAFDALGVLPVLALRVVLPAVAAWAIVRAARRDPILHRVAVVAVLVMAAGWTGLAVRNMLVG